MIDNVYVNDVSTIFSIVPFEIYEFKPGLYPGNFRISACLDDRDPIVYPVGASQHLMMVGGKREAIRITTPSYEIAASVVRDFLDGQLWTTPEARPGISWAQGNITEVPEEIYERIKLSQRRWFVNLCKQTDNEWKKQQNYRVVSDQARFAARSLGLDPEWLRTEEIGYKFTKCPGCSTMNDPQNAVCSNCKCILDEVKYKKLAFAS